MRKTLLVFALAYACACAAASAQSGRRPVAPPAPPAPEASPSPLWPDDESPEPEPERPRVTPAPQPQQQRPPLQVFPESLLSRELQALDKGSFRLSDFDGRVVVVNLWASWCGPCRAEIPEFEGLRREFAPRGVEFVGLTVEDPRGDAERVRRFAREMKFNFRLGWADRETTMTLMNGRNSIPQTYVLARGGRVLLHLRGYGAERGTAMVRDAIKRGLEVSSAEAR